MSEGQVSQAIIEVGVEKKASGQVSQVLIEVGVIKLPASRVSQALIEVMYEVHGRAAGPAVCHI